MLRSKKIVAVALTAACGVACGSATPGAVGEVDVAVYVAEKGACVASATSVDAGEACLAMVKSIRCAPGGLWSDASNAGAVCPNLVADGGAK